MKHTISNHHLTATVDSLGAQLVSLKKIDDDIEYIWKADPEVWGRHAPILFPVVGKLKNDEYHFQGKRYHLSQHGFARNMEFKNLVANSDTLIFELQESEESFRHFPFHFALQVSFYLWKNILYTKFEVHNTHGDTLYFSIGGHPGFTCPIDETSTRSDYYLEFENAESAQSHILEGGNISSRTKNVIENRVIKISDDVFDEDALIFKGLNSQKVSLKHNSGKEVLHFHFPNYPYLGIWSMNQTSPYICIEPWYGLADNESHNGDLTQKEGIQTLDPEGVFSCEFGIEIV